MNALCGNGIEEPGESCDDGDGNTEFCAYDEESCMVCNDLCELTSGLPTYCGDGIVRVTLVRHAMRVMDATATISAQRVVSL